MKSYICITTLMSLALSICVLFISLMQLLNGAQLLNTTCLLLFSPPAANVATIVVPLTNMYTSL